MSIVQVGLFAGGIAVGATGAFLLHSNNTPRAPVEQQQALQHRITPVIDPRLIDSGYQPSDGELIGPGGYPGPISDFLRQAAFISSYDRKLRHPSWTAEHLTVASLTRPTNDDNKPDRKNSVFREDERIPILFRAKLADYFRSGYDRGHMVPAADAKISQEAMNETFKLSNVAPQVGEGFNRDYWAHTEDFVRRLVGNSFSDVFVFTLPLYLPRQGADGKWRVSYEVIGDPPNISVPTHFAKVIYATGKPAMTSSASSPLSSRGGGGGVGGFLGLGTGLTALGAFVMPNAVIPNDAPLTNFVVPVEAVERAAGLSLFPTSIKSSSRPLCEVVECRNIIRDFSNRNNNNQQKKVPAAPLSISPPR